MPDKSVADMPAHQFFVSHQFWDVLEHVTIDPLENVLDILVHFHQIGVVNMARTVRCSGYKPPARYERVVNSLQFVHA